MQIDLEAALRLADRSEVQSGGNVAVYQLGAAVRGLVERVRELECVLNQMQHIVIHQTDRGQFGRTFHPLTCGNDSNHEPLYPSCDGEKVTLICADCDYVQEFPGHLRWK